MYTLLTNDFNVYMNDDFINKNFGRWKVISKIDNQNYLCECTCGKLSLNVMV